MCGVARSLVLRALAGESWAASLAMAPELGNRGRSVEVNRTGGSSKNENKVETAYSDRALMLHFPVLLLRARGMLTPLDDWHEGATLGSAWGLEAVCAGISALAADPPPPVDTAGAGVLLPVAGGGDLCPVMGMDDLLPAAGVGDLHPAAGVGPPFLSLQGVSRKGYTSKPSVPEEREVNHLHGEAIKKQKDAAEAAAARKRKRKEKHEKECKIARAEGKPRPVTPESTEEEDSSDVEHQFSDDDKAVTGAGSPPVYRGAGREHVTVTLGEVRLTSGSLCLLYTSPSPRDS